VSGRATERPVLVFFAIAGLFILLAGRNLSAPLRTIDEAHCCAAAARLVAAGGPLYGNVLCSKGPVLYWFTAGVFRLCGLYSVPAWRLAAIVWWVATSLVVYGAARTLVGRPAALAASCAFLLAAMNPAFQEIRGESLASLFIAASVGLVVRGVSPGGAMSLFLAGAAAAMATLTKQQAGLVLPVVVAFPVMAWCWRRDEGRLGLAFWRSVLVAGGFVVLVGVVWLGYALRGAGHAFYYCTWAYNWSFLRQCPAKGFFPPLAFMWGRVARYVSSEALLPLAVVGSVAGLAWKGPDRPGYIAWRAKVLMLACLLAAMWVAASPAGIPASSMYVHYQGLLYVPMCLLVGVCVEVALGRVRAPLWAVTVGLAVAYILIPATRLSLSAPFRLGLYVRMFGAWRLVLAAALLAAAGWLLRGRRVAGLAFLAWIVAFIAEPALLGWEGHHIAAALGATALGIAWQARHRRALWLVAAAAVVHSASILLDWSPQIGLAAGVAAWLLLDDGLSPLERGTFAGVYLGVVLPVALVAFVGVHGSLRELPGANFDAWWPAIDAFLSSWRLAGTLSLGGALLLALGARGLRGVWGRVRSSPLGLLVFATIGALVAGLWRPLEPRFVADAGSLSVLTAVLAIELFFRSKGVAPGTRAAILSTSACIVAAAVAVVVGLRSPFVARPTRDRERLAQNLPVGCRAYVWGSVFETELYVRARAIPAVPQIYTWLLEGVGPRPPSRGFDYYPPVATLEHLDHALCRALPDYVVICDEMPFSLMDLPSFGPILRKQYYATVSVPTGALFRRIER